MQLTSIGRSIGWLGAFLLGIGLVLLNPAILILATIVFATVLIEGMRFQTAIKLARHSISAVTEPRIVEAIVQKPTRVKTTFKNSSRLPFRVSEVGRIGPPEIKAFAATPQAMIPAEGEKEVEVFVTSQAPGMYEAEGTTLTLVARRRLLKQSLKFEDAVTVVVYPIAMSVNTLSNVTALTELSSDPIRRGIGTDLAGLRPSNFLEDYHRIDWKATARVGKLIARDFHAEKEPTIMLLIDVPSLKSVSAGDRSKVLFTQFANLFDDPFIALSPIGLVLYDEREILGRLDPQVGPEGRGRLIRTILEKFDLKSGSSQADEETSRFYMDLVRDRQGLVARTSRPDGPIPSPELFASFAAKIQPYYETAIYTHLRRVRRQGAFKAFEILATLTEPALIICLSSRRAKMSGLYEGAGLATALNHRVIVAVVEVGGTLIKRFDDLTDLGVSTVTTTPEELWRTINNELHVARASRTLPTRVSQSTK